MKRIFTSLRSRRIMLTAAIMLTSALNALAGGDEWYAYNVQLEGYPTGAGKVYADIDFVEDESTIVYSADQNMELATQNTFIYGYAQAAEGWQFIGWAKDYQDESTGEWVRENVVVSENDDFFSYAMLTLDNGVGGKYFDEEQQTEVAYDEEWCKANMPLEPTNWFRALFTHVAANVAEGQTVFGEVSIDKVVNNIGDEVTLTATPASEYNTFLNWTNELGEEVSTDPEFRVTVSGVATYTANFSDSRTVTLHFPEEGGYIEWYNPFDFALDYMADAYSPTISTDYVNNICATAPNAETSAPTTYLTINSSGYQIPGKVPSILYGMGDVTISPNAAYESDEPFSPTLFKWSGEGVNIADLSQEADHYYTFDATNGVFNLISEGTIAANKLYMQLPDSLLGEGVAQPSEIYLTQELAPVGIQAPAVAEASAKGQIFDLSGRRINAIRKDSFYILDGKVYYRKK